MASISEEIVAAVLALPREERARLAERLISSLDDDPEIEDAWREEVEERLEAYRQGDLETVEADDVLAQARERIDS